MKRYGSMSERQAERLKKSRGNSPGAWRTEDSIDGFPGKTLFPIAGQKCQRSLSISGGTNAGKLAQVSVGIELYTENKPSWIDQHSLGSNKPGMNQLKLGKQGFRGTFGGIDDRISGAG